MKLKQGGFTLLEVLVVAPIFLITTFTLLGYLIDQYGQLVQKTAKLNLAIEAQSLLFVLEDELTFAHGYDETITDDADSQLSDPNQPSGGWDFNTNPDTLIVQEYAATAHHRQANREFVYRNVYGCDAGVIESNPIVLNNIIYFVEGTSLYKRTLTPGNTNTLCNSNYKKQTCPEAVATTDCPADVFVTDKVSDFNVEYLEENNQPLDDEAGDSPTAARLVRVTLTLEDIAFGETVQESASLTIKNLN